MPSFRLALKVGELIKIYEVSENDGTTVLAKTDHLEMVSLLEKELIATPVENMRLLLESKEGETKWSNDRQGIRNFLTFNLLDGTSISKSYWINTGAFGSSLMLSDLFKVKVNEALDNSPYTLGNTIGILESPSL